MQIEDLNFRNLLSLLGSVDGIDGVAEISDEDYKRLIGTVTDKVDALKFVTTKLEAEALRLKTIEKEFTDARRTVENNLERLKSYIISSMEESGMMKIQGSRFKIAISERDVIEVKEIDSEVDYLFLRQVSPELIKRIYVVDKNRAKKIMQTEVAPAIADYVEIKTNKHIRWGVLKGE